MIVFLVSFILKLKVTRQEFEFQKRKKGKRISILGELLYFNGICVEFVCRGVMSICNFIMYLYCTDVKRESFRLRRKVGKSRHIFHWRNLADGDKYSRARLIDFFCIFSRKKKKKYRTVAPSFLTSFDDVGIISRARSSPRVSQVVAVSYIELVAALRRKHEIRGGAGRGVGGEKVRNMYARRSFNNPRFLFPPLQVVRYCFTSG